MARSSGGPGVQTKLKRAGASKVISPYSIGARRMAHLIVRPTVSDFIDLTMRAGELDLTMEELKVSAASHLNGKNLIESEIRKKYDVIVVAIKRQDGAMLFNPRSETVIMAGDILIVLGANDHILGLGREM
jgi:voltage-gated potassium channel